MTRRTALAGAVLWVALAGCGGGGGGVSTTVTGMVRDSADGDNEVGGATVVIGGASATTYTLDNASSAHPVGSFEIKNPTVGATTAVVTAPGKAPQTIAFQPGIAKGNNSGLTLFLNIGQIRGRVVGIDSKPAVGAFVVVSTTLGSAFASTEADGTFLVENIVPGDAEVTASLGPANVVKAVTVGSGVSEVGDLQLVEDNNPNPPDRMTTIRGTVSNRVGGIAIGGASVILRRGGVQVETTTTDTQGKYGFLRPVGTYSITVLAAGFVDGDTGEFTLSSANTPPNAPLVKDIALDSR